MSFKFLHFDYKGLFRFYKNCTLIIFLARYNVKKYDRNFRLYIKYESHIELSLISIKFPSPRCTLISGGTPVGSIPRRQIHSI